MPRYIDADALIKNTIFNPCHVPYITKSDVENAPTVDVVERKDIQAELDLAYKHGWSDCFAERRWIPVTDRLPEDGDRRKFLLSVKWYDDVCDETLECVDDLQYFWIDGKWYDVEEHKEFDDFYTITAWMPLPKPYERSEE